MLNITHYQRKANQDHNEVSFHTSLAVIQKSTSNKCWKGCGEKGTLLHCLLVGMQTSTATMEHSVEIP